ncbi:MAG: U32 family peptidase [Eubacteriales bacterium]|nr:U32 family peptidase [Eubacteriales bacterium]
MSIYQAELLAPAGSYEAFEAVLGAGADAVYVGGNSFGARAYARNFSEEELVKAIRVSHLHNRKLYMTVNTLVKNREMERELYEFLAPFYEAGLDAVLVQDFGVLSFIQEYFPELPIHASTQMAVTGPEGMKYLEKKGLTRVVAARELTLPELQNMHANSPLEIESFIHGALCYSYSGRCLMSSILGGRSGNRGRCAQPCRLPYQASLEGNKPKNKKGNSPLSLKDMNTIMLLPEILEAGVYSLKIEGRMKQPSYGAGVTAIYRKYLDLLLEKGADHYRVDPEDHRTLLDLFSRGGSCSGYYKTYHGTDMMAFSNDKKIEKSEYVLQSPKREIRGELSLHTGEPAYLKVTAGDQEAVVYGEVVQEALKQPLSEERIEKQMQKMGETPFVWKELSLDLSGNLFMPVKQINELRRNALGELEEKLSAAYRRTLPETPEISLDAKNISVLPKLFASCETKEQAEILWMEETLDGLYVPLDLAEQMLQKEKNEKKLFLVMPEITRFGVPGDVLQKILAWKNRGLDGILVRDLETFAALKEAGLSSICVMDASMYTWNNRGVDYWEQENVLRTTAPLELNGRELQHRKNKNSEMVVYGYLPLMVSVQCVRDNLYGCNHKRDCLTLKDRKGTDFSVQCVCDPWKGSTTERHPSCYNIIYNSLPLSLLAEAKQVLSLGMSGLRLNFTWETAGETREIFRAFSDVYQFGEHRELSGTFTKGHFKRGAE